MKHLRSTTRPCRYIIQQTTVLCEITQTSIECNGSEITLCLPKHPTVLAAVFCLNRYAQELASEQQKLLGKKHLINLQLIQFYLFGFAINSTWWYYVIFLIN